MYLGASKTAKILNPRCLLGNVQWRPGSCKVHRSATKNGEAGTENICDQAAPYGTLKHTNMTAHPKNKTMWIFGYGSLIWRPDFDFVEHRDGYLEGWARKFYQGSTDHRGVPGAPGRVATLVREPGAKVWGRAYRIDGEEADAILAQLDHREKGGYERHQVDVLCASGACVQDALVYVATRENPVWQGPAPVQTIARQIRAAHGPSGANIEYLLELAESLRNMEAPDPHVFAIERALQRL